jgi:hypothetical protein
MPSRSVCMHVTDRTENLRSRRREGEMLAAMVPTFLAEYRA